METKRIFNLIILDASGSMSSIYNQALSGVNETIQTIRSAQEKHPEMQQFLTLASFNAGEDYLHLIYEAEPIANVKDVTKEDYVTSGCTALYDAMGDMVSGMQQKASHEDVVLVTVITDGYENSSRRWSGKQIKSIVQELRQQGWTFNYIGANQDVDQVADSIGIHNVLAFKSNEAGTKKMFSRLSSATGIFYDKICCSFETEKSVNSPIEEDRNFFSADDNDNQDDED